MLDKRHLRIWSLSAKLCQAWLHRKDYSYVFPWLLILPRTQFILPICNWHEIYLWTTKCSFQHTRWGQNNDQCPNRWCRLCPPAIWQRLYHSSEDEDGRSSGFWAIQGRFYNLKVAETLEFVFRGMKKRRRSIANLRGPPRNRSIFPSICELRLFL